MSSKPQYRNLHVKNSSPVATWSLLIGMVSIVAVSVAYLASPPLTAMPVQPLHPDLAWEGARTAGATLRWIALLGILGDPLTTAACLVLASQSLKSRCESEAMGWLLIGLACFFFLAIDTIAGAVLAPLAKTVGREGFAGIKILFDQFFIAGTACLGVGQFFIAAPVAARSPALIPPILGWPILANGLLALASALAALLGANAAPTMGASVAIGAVLFSLLAVRMLDQARRA
jgi:hypothetical protein